MRLARLFALFTCVWLMASRPAEAQRNIKKDHRLGFVAIKFDDGSAGHYINAAPILEKYGVRGIFCVNPGNLAKQPGGTKITARQCTEMYKAGHEIVDHTLHHESAIWGDDGTLDQWTKRAEESLRILNGLGVRVRGWNLPGGKGSVYNRALHDMMPKYFDYARGGNCDFGYAPFELCWNFKGDPYGYRGISGSWESYVQYRSGTSVSRDRAKQAVERLKTTRADLFQKGVLVGFTFHLIVDENQARWALEELCKWIAENSIPNATTHEAFEAFRNPRKHYPADVEQIPCTDFQYDLDGNGRPDGWLNCAFAPDDVKSPQEGRVAECRDSTRTALWGPEPGKTKVSFLVKSADGKPHKMTLRIRGVEILEDYRRSGGNVAETTVRAGNDWQQLAASFDVSPRTGQCSIEFLVPDGGPIHVASPSWRRDMRGDAKGSRPTVLRGDTRGFAQ